MDTHAMVDRLLSELAEDGAGEVPAFGGRGLAVGARTFAALVDEHFVVDLGQGSAAHEAMLGIDGADSCADPAAPDAGAGDWIRLPDYQCVVWDEAARHALARAQSAGGPA